jgi:predicted DNA binding CopG/RHH family protein
MKGKNILGANMRKEYDFSQLKGRKNPFVKRLKREIRVRVENETIEYFKNLSEETGLPYTSLINLYLNDCAQERRKLKWA